MQQDEAVKRRNAVRWAIVIGVLVAAWYLAAMLLVIKQ